jgi:hypothetical protein
MSQLRPLVVAAAAPMLHGDQSYLEPAAAGRAAFWQGRSISANPLVGAPAREWTSGWKQAHAALVMQSGQDAWAVSRTERLRLFRVYRPVDVPRSTR